MATVYMEFNSVFQAQNSLTRNFLPDYHSGMSWKARLKDTFNHTGWSIAELSRRSGVNYDNTVKYVSGKVDKPRGNNLAKLAAALDVDPIWLETGIDPNAPARMVPMKGYVGAGGRFEAVENGDLGEIEAPANADRATVAATVRGDSMLPLLRDGWIIYWSRLLPPGDMVNQLAVVQLTDKTIMVKTVRNGSRPGLFTLTSFNSADITDVMLDWAAPIDWIKPR